MTGRKYAIMLPRLSLGVRNVHIFYNKHIVIIRRYTIKAVLYPWILHLSTKCNHDFYLNE